MKYLVLRTAVAAVSVALGCAACSNSLHKELKTPASGPVPAAAAKVVTHLVSQDPATVRDSLAYSYSTQIGATVLAPAGTRILVQPGTWQQSGDEARLRAIVAMPHRKSVTEIVYLVREDGQWRILFTDGS